MAEDIKNKETGLDLEGTGAAENKEDTTPETNKTETEKKPVLVRGAEFVTNTAGKAAGAVGGVIRKHPVKSFFAALGFGIGVGYKIAEHRLAQDDDDVIDVEATEVPETPAIPAATILELPPVEETVPEEAIESPTEGIFDEAVEI